MGQPVSSPPPHAPGDLEALLETERALSERVTAAHAEADAIVAAARDEVARREAGLDAELAAARQEVEVRLAAERERRIASVREEFRRRTAAWETLGDDRIERAALAVVAALVAAPDGPAERQ